MISSTGERIVWRVTPDAVGRRPGGQPPRVVPSRQARCFSTAAGPQGRWTAAVTLIELLVVIAIVVVIAGLSVPGLTGYQQRLQTKAAMRQTMGLLSLARQRAISSQTPHAVELDAEQQRLVVKNTGTGEILETQVRLPAAVEVRFESGGEATEEPVIFRAGGALQGRTVAVIVAGRERAYTIDVTAATGAITVAD